MPNLDLLTLIEGYLVSINLVTFCAYGADKLFAASGSWRIRERTLLLLALFGGSPAALLAMKLFRHKTIKPKFQILIALILLIQALIFAALFHSQLGFNTPLTTPTDSLY